MTREYRYLALGSSSTRGAGASPQKSYVELIALHLGTTSVLNLGSGGATVDDFVASLEQIVQFAPNVITVLPFTDIVRTPPARFVDGYTALFAGLEAQIFFGDLRIEPAYAQQYAPRDREVVSEKNQAVCALAELCPRVKVVPVFDQNVAHPEWNAPDGHPNDLGHSYLASAFIGHLNSVRVP